MREAHTQNKQYTFDEYVKTFLAEDDDALDPIAAPFDYGRRMADAAFEELPPEADT